MGVTKYDWKKLKKDFLIGDWQNLSTFFKDKGIHRGHMYRTKGWLKEKGRIADNIIETTAKELTKDLAAEAREIRERQAKMARFMQLKGAEKLKTLTPDELSAEDARKLVVTGMQEERKATGLEGNGKGEGANLTQININTGPKTNLDKILEGGDYGEILEIIADLKRPAKAIPLAEGSTESPGDVEDGRSTGLLDMGERSMDDRTWEETGVPQQEVPSTSVQGPTPEYGSNEVGPDGTDGESLGGSSMAG